MGSLKRPDDDTGRESLLNLDIESINDLATLRAKLKEAQAALLLISEDANVRACSEQLPEDVSTEEQNSNGLMFDSETMAAMLRRENELRTCEETQKAYAGENNHLYNCLTRLKEQCYLFLVIFSTTAH